MISAISCYPARRSCADPDVILPGGTTASAATPAWLISGFKSIPDRVARLNARDKVRSFIVVTSEAGTARLPAVLTRKNDPSGQRVNASPITGRCNRPSL